MKQWKKYLFLLEGSEKEIRKNVYQEACRLVGMEPTDRQWRKYRNGEGEVYKKRTTAKRRLVQAARRTTVDDLKEW